MRRIAWSAQKAERNCGAPLHCVCAFHVASVSGTAQNPLIPSELVEEVCVALVERNPRGGTAALHLSDEEPASVRDVDAYAPTCALAANTSVAVADAITTMRTACAMNDIFGSSRLR